ncbi:MAG: rod shape-determining protein RodA [Actinobacteria bacterium]|nr:rod shape-determining protein RodA [Actinomycetota bacterium]MBM3816386.1 rod shape-determining protein RodA [Actinomycetota bacterium]
MSIAFRVRQRPTDPRGSASVLDPWRNIDWSMIIAVATLLVIGVFNIFATTSPRLVLRGADPYYFTQRQVIFLIVAAAALFGVMFVGHEWLRGKAMWFYAPATFSLLILLLWSRTSGETKLSFDLGPIAVQPAEIMKPIIVLVLAAWFAEAATRSLPYDEIVRAGILAGIPFGLILFQPDLGSAMTLAAGVVGVLVVAGTQRRHFIGATILAIGSFIASIWSGLVRDYQLERFTALWNQNNTTDSSLQELVLQVRYAKRAVAAGGYFGKGYLQGELTNGRFIPVQSTDFPFSALGEQFGLVGCVIVLALFAFILLRVWIVGRNANSPFGRFIVAGVFTTLAWQVFQNIGMTIGITPVSGLPLPFISYGGSHLVAWALMIGLVQSVEMRRSA